MQNIKLTMQNKLASKRHDTDTSVGDINHFETEALVTRWPYNAPVSALLRFLSMCSFGEPVVRVFS
jgi:hypothetical protein